MNYKGLTRIAALAVVGVAAAALAGLPWADARPAATAAAETGTNHLRCVHFDVDDQPVCGVERPGPRGLRGAPGPAGPTGLSGATGPTGAQGPQGPVGPAGPAGAQGGQGDQGAQGDQGVQGVQGLQGAPGHTVVVAGTKVTEVAPAAGDPTGTEITPTVAQCPATGDPEAYGGGVQIQKSGTESGGDVVTVDQHYLGTFDNGRVDALPAGTAPGTVSTQAANAYEAEAVVTELAGGDTATVQSFVVCGP